MPPMISAALERMSGQRSLYVIGASLSRKRAVILRSFFFCSPPLPGQQHENSKLLPGGHTLAVSRVRQTVVAAYLVN